MLRPVEVMVIFHNSYTGQLVLGNISS